MFGVVSAIQCISKSVGCQWQHVERMVQGWQREYSLILLGLISMQATHSLDYSGNVDSTRRSMHFHQNLVGEQPTQTLTLSMLVLAMYSLFVLYHMQHSSNSFQVFVFKCHEEQPCKTTCHHYPQKYHVTIYGQYTFTLQNFILLHATRGPNRLKSI